MFSLYEIKQVVDTESIYSEVKINLSASKDHMQLFAADTVSHILPKLLSEEDITLERIIGSESYDAPVIGGNEYGELIVKFKDDYIIGKTKLITKESVDRSSVLYAIEKIKAFVTSTFFIVTVITAVVLFLIYTVVVIRSRRKHRYWFK